MLKLKQLKNYFVLLSFFIAFDVNAFNHKNNHDLVDGIVLKHDVKKGDLVTSDDFIEKSKIIKNTMQYMYFTKIEQLDNQAYAQKFLKKDNPVRLSDIGTGFVIKKGQTITARFEKNNLVIEVPCVALSDGNTGNYIRIKNLNTNKILNGKILNEGVVLIQ